MAKSLIVFAQFVHQVRVEKGASAYAQGDIPNNLKSWLFQNIEEIDKAAINSDSFWGSCVRNP